MILRLVIFYFCGCFYVSMVRAQAAAQVGASLSQLLEQEALDQNIKDILGSPDADIPSTATPDIHTNNGVGICTCVPYYLCNNGSVNTNGEGALDIRIESPCESYLEVCCNKDDQAEVAVTPTPPIVKKSGCGNRHPDGVGFQEIEQGVYRPPRNGRSIIIGDKENEALFGEFPWMVAILREEAIEGRIKKLNLFHSGGALIHPQVVVTAAHCVSNKNKTFKVRAGEWDTQHAYELLYPHQDREVQSTVIHPEFYEGALYNDIALLYLAKPFEIAENVQTICLPPQGTVLNSASCLVTGWGKEVFGQKGKYHDILKKIDLPVVANPQCEDRLRTTRLGKFFQLHKSFICAGGVPGKDTCTGDGGSPLVCLIEGQKDRYYHMGIVSWGIGCGEDNTPGVYVYVPLFRDWIDAQVKSFGLDTSAYEYLLMY